MPTPLKSHPMHRAEEKPSVKNQASSASKLARPFGFRANSQVFPGVAQDAQESINQPN